MLRRGQGGDPRIRRMKSNASARRAPIDRPECQTAACKWRRLPTRRSATGPRGQWRRHDRRGRAPGERSWRWTQSHSHIGKVYKPEGTAAQCLSDLQAWLVDGGGPNVIVRGLLLGRPSAHDREYQWHQDKGWNRQGDKSGCQPARSITRAQTGLDTMLPRETAEITSASASPRRSLNQFVITYEAGT